MRRLKFAVGDAHGTSRYWIASVNANEPRAVVTRERIGGTFHLAYKGGSYAHVKIFYRGRDHTRTVEQLPEVASGVRRLLQINLPNEAARYAASKSAGVVVIESSPDTDEWTVFELVLEAPSVSSKTWPGRNAGTGLVGRLELPDASRLCVLYRRARGVAGSVTFPNVPDDEQQAVREAVAAGTGYAFIYGETDDGTLAVLELHSRARRHVKAPD